MIGKNLSTNWKIANSAAAFFATTARLVMLSPASSYVPVCAINEFPYTASNSVHVAFAMSVGRLGRGLSPFIRIRLLYRLVKIYRLGCGFVFVEAL